MKLYYVHYLSMEKGEIEAFTSKAAARKRHNELRRGTAKHHKKCIQGGEYAHCRCDNAVEQLFDLSEIEFPISAEGIRTAFECGAFIVIK